MYDEISEEVKKEYFETNLKAAKIGFVESIRAVAGAYLSGFGVEKNFDEAIKWYEKAIAEGDLSAAVTLGKIYKEKDIEKSIFYLSREVENNNLEAIKILAGIYEAQNNFEKMFECYQRGANLGNGHFMEEVAACYLNGRGVAQDDLKALDWYIKAAEWDWNCSNNIETNAMRMVTKIYNKHFKFSDKKFLGYYVTTEKFGHFNAMFGIAAELYKTDKYRALQWYRMADRAGDYDAAVAVAYICNKDFGIRSADTNYYNAGKWYEKAVEFDNINAAKNLAIMYRVYVGVSGGGYLPDVTKSIYWLNVILKMLEVKDENEILAYDLCRYSDQLFAKVKIIGVGDFGAKMVNYSIANMFFGVEFAVVGTKNETLLKSSAPQRIKVPDCNDEETRKKLSELVKDLNLLFIFTDLTDDNISTQIAESAKNALKVTILPSSNFNKEKIDKFQDVMDSLIIVEEKNTELMLSVVRCINSIVSESGMVGMGYEDVKSVLEKSKSGRGYVAYGRVKRKTTEH